jgi:hypothetical protein
MQAKGVKVFLGAVSASLSLIPLMRGNRRLLPPFSGENVALL